MHEEREEGMEPVDDVTSSRGCSDEHDVSSDSSDTDNQYRSSSTSSSSSSS